MTLEQLDRIRGNFVLENASFFRVALRDINREVIHIVENAGSPFLAENNIRIQLPDINKRHMGRAYDRMWNKTPVYFATEAFKELSNTKALADIFNPLNAFQSQITKRVQMVGNTTMNKYTSLLREGRGLTNDIAQIAKFMNTSIVGAYIKLRAMQIARTETVYASNAGRRAGAIATGLPIVKTWVTRGDEKVRLSHEIANGQQRPLATPFNVNGEQLMFPADFSLGASAENIINCRCAEIYTINN